MPYLEIDKEGDIEVTITKNSIKIKTIGENGKVLSENHAFLSGQTKIKSSPCFLTDITEEK